jgi:Fic family protein
MKLPQQAPNLSEVLRGLGDERLQVILGAGIGPSIDGRYLHWDEVRHRPPPLDLTPREWWAAIRFARNVSARRLPLLSSSGQPFTYTLPDEALELLHWIDQYGAGAILTTEAIDEPALKRRYLVSTLIEEAITSSQLEGAATTRKVAKDMLRSGRSPRDKSERMIANNYLAMQALADYRDQPMTLDVVTGLQWTLTEGTLHDAGAAGRIQQPGDDRVRVISSDGTVVHIPPPADQLEERLSSMCAFANGETGDGFIHPVVRAIVLHLWLGYDHPFEDGNGRTARALFYWSMLRSRYWIVEFLSISRVILRAPAQYSRAFQFTERDAFDSTYFILHQLRVIKQAIEDVRAYLRAKMTELRKASRLLRDTDLNHRQIALLSHAMQHPDSEYSFQSHRTSHRVAFQTARTDLLDLEQRGYLQRTKRGKRFFFIPVSDLDRHITDPGALLLSSEEAAPPSRRLEDDAARPGEG